MSPNSDVEKAREQNLCEDKHREVSDFIQMIERRLDVLNAEIRTHNESDEERESLEYDISRMTKELDRAYTEQNELEERLIKLGSSYGDSIDGDDSCSTDCDS